MKANKIDSFLIILCIVIGFALYHKEALEHFSHNLPNIWTNSEPNVGISKVGQLHYFGEINNEGYELLRRVYSDSKKKITNKTIIIGSRGGDTFAALKIGNFIKDKKFSIKVPSLCLGSCAHYIFPAAHFKYLEKNALVGFNEPILSGSKFSLQEIFPDIKVDSETFKIQDNDLIQVVNRGLPTPCVFQPESATSAVQSEKMIQDMLISCAKYLNRQRSSFYKKLGVDSRLLVAGMPKLSQAIMKNNNQINSYYYDSDSLKALGVERVIYPRDWEPQNNPEYKNMIEIKLSDFHQLR